MPLAILMMLKPPKNKSFFFLGICFSTAGPAQGHWSHRCPQLSKAGWLFFICFSFPFKKVFSISWWCKNLSGKFHHHSTDSGATQEFFPVVEILSVTAQNAWKGKEFEYSLQCWNERFWLVEMWTSYGKLHYMHVWVATPTNCLSERVPSPWEINFFT